jgi:hypothetical protein
LIHVEDILWIIFRLEPLEPLVVGTVRGGYWIVRFIVPKIIHLPARRDETTHLRIRLPRPCTALVSVSSVHPLAEYQKVVPVPTVGKGRVGRSYLGNSAMQVF